MKLNSLASGEAWMTAEESDLNLLFLGGVESLLLERNVVDGPLLALRVNDVAVSWLLARRLESGLAAEDSGDPPRPTPPQADAMGKSRERLRKAIKELEEYCTRAGTPIDTGLADLMKPVIQQIQGPRPFCTLS